MTGCFNASLSLTDFEYYYDYATESLAEDLDLTLGDWLYEPLDTTGKLPLAPQMIHACRSYMSVLRRSDQDIHTINCSLLLIDLYFC